MIRRDIFSELERYLEIKQQELKVAEGKLARLEEKLSSGKGVRK